MRKILKTILGSLVIFVFSASYSLALDMGTKAEIENLRKRIEQLEKKLEEEGAAEEITVGDEDEGFVIEIADKKLMIWGSVSLNGIYSQEEGGDDVSDLILSEAQLGFMPMINDRIRAHFVLLYEEGEDIAVDEANITLSQYGKGMGFNFVGGLQYLPYGNYSSSMISDPLTLELGETSETAVVFGWANEVIGIRVGAFNGDVDAGDDDVIDSLVASLEINTSYGITVGASYISDLAGSGIELIQPDLGGSISHYVDSVAGASFFVSAEYGMFVVNAEYVFALDEFEQASIVAGENLTGPEPRAFNLELSFTPIERWNFALRFEKAKDFQDDPERYGFTISYGIFTHMVLALEYLRTEADVDIDMVTAELGISF
jgi:hypothetical protein